MQQLLQFRTCVESMLQRELLALVEPFPVASLHACSTAVSNAACRHSLLFCTLSRALRCRTAGGVLPTRDPARLAQECQSHPRPKRRRLLLPWAALLHTY